ncbi:MAG: ORF6N domain-containing protein [Candidatus ainarchaeum sp.]|nr:ORF6N domain-containing protein [Candidatus ainarchaeum sp.]
MNSLVSIDVDNIKNKIYLVRGIEVILDKDLANLYSVKATRLREQVKRNIKRFPTDFMFQLNDFEIDFLVSQNAIPSKKYLGGYRPYVFTEQGVANLSSILNSEKAILMNIQIMRAFVLMRKFIVNNQLLFNRLNQIESKQIIYDEKLNEIFELLNSKNLPEKGIFFDGQIFDAYKFVLDIIRSAKSSIVLIDNYIDDSVLTLFTKRNENVVLTILTTNLSKQLEIDLKKFNEQYPLVKIKQFSKSHDRFIIIDNQIVYHFGASLKDLGKKWFAFSKFDKTAFELIEKIKYYK